MIFLPINVGTRVVVSSIMYAVARVKECNWLDKESRWEIILDWGQHGTSRVYDHDENETWYRYEQNN